MSDPESDFNAEETERRFRVAIKCAMRYPLTDEEEKLRREIVAGWEGDETRKP